MAQPSTSEHYIGTELELFRHATNWKEYLAAQIRPLLGQRVLEVGAGMGGTTERLAGNDQTSWVCLEPDPELIRRIQEKCDRGELPRGCVPRQGILSDLGSDEQFDTILYIDVLEHIEHDAAEMAAAAAHLSPGGRIVVLSPSYQWLYSPFDQAIGHYRRYSRKTLRAAAPDGLDCVRMRYLDSVGVMASAANRFLMKQGMPTPSQLRFWDRVLVPLSRWVDRLTAFTFGKSILGVWRK